MYVRKLQIITFTTLRYYGLIKFLVPVSAIHNCSVTLYPIFEIVFVTTIPSRDDVREFVNTSLIRLSDVTADQGRSIHEILKILEI